MKVKIAEHAGYCYGVERALELTEKAAMNSPKPVHTLGRIIHNPEVVKKLTEEGITPVKDLEKMESGTVIISSHGVGPQVTERAEKKGIEVVDATCPFVKKAQKRAKQLVREGYKLYVIGERNHPEIVGILAHAGEKAKVIEKLSDIDLEIEKATTAQRIGIVVQTTQAIKNLKDAVSKLIPYASELKVFNTICGATNKRQEAARKLAKEADVMVVVGGRISANTTRLAQICQQTKTPTYHIETAREIDPEWFDKESTVGVTAGASTPNWILDEVLERLKKIDK